MKNLMLVTRIVGLCLLVSACQKGNETGAPMPQVDTQVGLNIDCGRVSHDEMGNASLKGPEVAQKGQPVTYSLSGVEGCASEKVMAFENEGTYQVSAQLKTGSESITLSVVTQVIGSSLSITGPRVAVEGLNATFSLSNPEQIAISSIVWDFGDGSGSSGGNSVTTVYGTAGEYELSALVGMRDGNSKRVVYPVTVVPLEDQFLCVRGFNIASPASSMVGVPVNFSAFLPSCLQGQVTRIEWNFGDGGNGSGLSVSHSYDQVGSYTVIATVYHPVSGNVWFNYPVQISIENNPEPTTTTSTTLPPSTTTSTTVSTTTTTLPACVEGETRERQGALSSRTLQCGVGGSQVNEYQEVIVERCENQGDHFGFKEISRREELVREGQCQGQSCTLPDGSELKHGQSRLMFSATNPSAACSTVSQVRTCQNGVLGGSNNYSHLSCTDGCENFGPNGTTQTGVVTGQVQVPLQCQFGETGFFDVFNQVADMTCVSGTVVTSNSRQGGLVTAGQCPGYSWQPTNEYTACTAACGGVQTRIYECKDSSGNLATPDRCGQLQAETRVCDGDKESVRRSDTVVTQEEANSSAVCPKNQIGVVVKQRDVTVTNVYACIDHSVKLESSNTSYGPWVEERYCRDFVAHRCSQDSLNNTEAHKRYEWLVKCAPQVPVIKEFLDQFEDVQAKSGKEKFTLDGSGRILYPTFMNRATKPEKAWIAPKGAKGENTSCNVPNTVYVAAVCVSSCATPEELIIAEDVKTGKLSGVPFINALTSNIKFVGTLSSHSGMNSKELKKTRVDQWVTELVDSEHQILEFRTKSGGLLKVTLNHPLVSEEGKMREAVDFKVGDSLVKLGGVKDEIVSITQVPYFGKVYNVFVKSNDLIKNVVVTNGYLNGTAFYQNEGSKHLNRVVFQKRITRGVFE